ncbi:hypothetical protein FOQG_04155 [Fusarium oxysporum f. sp. raphani 54005]|uniref:Uncharacterized protein n=2 Tax=Fusarium oxysporum TaxID=5507 RepID=X0CXK8_FUSOX|nr:hypothetical protein FOVG_10200 [Fusarium oxysporum f. sp. pisi HDV247]EXK95604.1 hypothetical protein FOQG_04155 [Fusarium oxysporum f. sp. raphani 54005]
MGSPLRYDRKVSRSRTRSDNEVWLHLISSGPGDKLDSTSEQICYLSTNWFGWSHMALANAARSVSSVSQAVWVVSLVVNHGNMVPVQLKSVYRDLSSRSLASNCGPQFVTANLTFRLENDGSVDEG